MKKKAIKKCGMKNPFQARMDALAKKILERNLDFALVTNQANVCSLIGENCDNACLLITPKKKGEANVVCYTDFRYIPAMARTSPWLKTDDIAKLTKKKLSFAKKKIGYESCISHARFQAWEKTFEGATFVDILSDIQILRAVKTIDEQNRLRRAAKINDEIWQAATKKFRAGMTEKEMARVIQHLQLEKGDGEAFETIVCVGANAAECHHVPDDTIWNGKAPVLIDMGVRVDGVCSDMTRNVVPKKPTPLYKKVYALVREANVRAIKAARAGMSVADLDKVARDFLTKNNFGKAFGHALGHGVGIEIHEAPGVSAKSKVILQEGMVITIEPGVYLPENLGVRVEDLILITKDGCEVLSSSQK